MKSFRFVVGQRLLGDDRLRRVVDDADLREALGRIVFEVRIERRRRRLRAHVADRDGVAVGRAPARRGSCRWCRRRRRCSRRRSVLAAACAAMCSPTRRGDDVGRPAGGERHDDGDRLARILLRQRRQCSAQASATRPPAARKRMRRIVTLPRRSSAYDHGRRKPRPGKRRIDAATRSRCCGSVLLRSVHSRAHCSIEKLSRCG